MPATCRPRHASCQGFDLQLRTQLPNERCLVRKPCRVLTSVPTWTFPCTLVVLHKGYILSQVPFLTQGLLLVLATTTGAGPDSRSGTGRSDGSERQQASPFWRSVTHEARLPLKHASKSAMQYVQGTRHSLFENRRLPGQRSSPRNSQQQVLPNIFGF